MENVDYGKVFENIVSGTADYIRLSGRKSMILGVSGGIDSTVVSIIGMKVSQILDIPLIGRSLPIKNTTSEKDAAFLVGKAFFKDGLFKEHPIEELYRVFLKDVLETEEGISFETDNPSLSELEEAADLIGPIARGNIQARLRMNYLYNLAGITNGLVLDTDNLTEHYLGFYTIHGDEGDFNPIGGLWKTEVYGLAKFLLGSLNSLKHTHTLNYSKSEWAQQAYDALSMSIGLTPTDGNGVSASDLDQIGGNSYLEVDSILQVMVEQGRKPDYTEYKNKVLADKLWARYKGSEFKRKQRPIKLGREETFKNI